MRLLLPLVLVSIFLAGCGPRYVIQHEYIPPLHHNAQSCLDQCAFTKQTCQTQCQQERQYCLEDAYIRARKIEQSELSAYDLAYMRYQMDFNQYRHFLHLWENDYYIYRRDFELFQSRCERERDTFTCRKRDELRHQMNRLMAQRPREPLIPIRPDFNQILSYQQSTCPIDCGCQINYDSCFTGCGGTVIPHKICVENCD